MRYSVLITFPNSGAGTFFQRGWGSRKYKIEVSLCPKFAKHLHQPVISVRVIWVLRILKSLNLNSSHCLFSSHCLGAKPTAARGNRFGGVASSAWRVLGIYYQNNPFLDMFQLNFCLKNFQTCLLLYISVLNVAF